MKACVVVTIAAVLGLLACSIQGTLAQSEVFAELRPELIESCCSCLARRGTSAAGASCAPAVLVDGGVVLPDDAEVATGPVVEVTEFNDSLDPGEIPCLCEGNAGSCIGSLSAGASIAVTGACLHQPGFFASAPCESACRGVLTYDPVPSL